MRIDILGSLEAEIAGRSVAPTAAKPRQVLALLALRTGQVVPVPTLVEELWGDNPPRSALTTLQTYVMQLRRLIAAALPAPGPSAKDVLATHYNGYVLTFPPEATDVGRYERLAHDGRHAADCGDHEAASKLLGAALAVWRGVVLADVPRGPALAIEVTRLEESRLGVLEVRLDADLELGRHHGLLSELAVLTARHPMNEHLCAQQMIALCRSGRQWQALEAFTSLRGTLVEELGVEPSPRLYALRQAVLRASSGSEAPGVKWLHALPA